MATTTPNFGWPVPTSTDLVKDGATAIEALGDGIDASLLDLKGGTTGQILAKTSATDLDFVWTTPNPGDITGVTAGTGISGGGTSGDVTITNSMATAIDAKGDLIGGTGADAFARLAVGTNGQLLSADSTAATGLAWSYGGKSTVYTPTWGVVSGTAPAIGNGSLSGFYCRVGDLVYFQVSIIFGSTTTAGTGTYNFGLPFSTVNAARGVAGNGQVLDAGVSWYRGYVPVTVEQGYTDKFVLATAAGLTVSNSSPFLFSTGDTIYAWGVYSV